MLSLNQARRRVPSSLNLYRLLTTSSSSSNTMRRREGVMMMMMSSPTRPSSSPASVFTFHTSHMTRQQKQPLKEYEVNKREDKANTQPEESETVPKKKKPISMLRKALRVFILGFFGSMAYWTYQDSQAIVASEHNVRDWEPELEKSMPLVFRSHVLRHLGNLRGKKEIMARIVENFAPEMSPFKTPNVPEYRIDWVDPISGKILSGDESFIDLLKKCKLASDIYYLRAPLCAQNFHSSSNKNYGIVELLRQSHMTFKIPLQITIEKTINGQLVQHKIAGNYVLTLVKFDDISRSTPNPLLPGRDDWYIYKAELMEVGSNIQIPHDRHKLVLHEELAPGNFHVVREGSKVLQYHKDDAIEYIERHYARLGPASLFTTKTTINKYAVKT